MWTLHINDENKLLVLKLSDALTLPELSDILKEIYDKYDGKFAAYNRLIDISALTDVNINLDTVSSNIREYRRQIKPDHPVKIALFITQKYIGGFAYLYKLILGDELFQTEIFDSLDDCAQYLSADKKLLENAE